MVFDIPNIVTLPIEIGVAVMILWLDRRQRQRETASIKRVQEQQKQFRESEIRQRKRFTNWSKETSKRQLMMLESIMATLDSDKVSDFQKEVGSRYTREINDDISDLEELLEKKHDLNDDDPELEANIESKIEEIESAKSFVEYFLPEHTLNQIQKIANSAKQAFQAVENLSNIPKDTDVKSGPTHSDSKSNMEQNGSETEKETMRDNLNLDWKTSFEEFQKEKHDFSDTIEKKIKSSIDEAKREIKKSIPGSEDTREKIMKFVDSSLKELDSMMQKKKDREGKESETEQDNKSSDNK